jgi:UDP-N-acetylmuramoylalanine--D-glutamate ligase
MDLKGKKVLIAGFSKTGVAVCRFLLQQGAEIKVSEKKSRDKIDGITEWSKKGVEFETGGHNPKSFLEAEFIIPSPGIPFIPELKKAEKKEIPIFSEVELAFRFLKGKIVGITGSNGKSTVTTLIYRILKEAGLRSFLAGNIGTPLISFAEKSTKDDIYVTELSSFQLTRIKKFSCDLSLFLNITPDHIDWHKGFENYFSAKKKLIFNQKKEGIAILNRDDKKVWGLRNKGPSRVFGFSRKTRPVPGCCLENGYIKLFTKREEKLMKTSEIPLPGIHNQENVMASALAGHILEVPLKKIKESIKKFTGLEHRLEIVRNVQGIDFYNDSKATNIDAALKSIQSFDRRIILILGGRDKGGDFVSLQKDIKKRVKKVILMGEAREKIRKDLSGIVAEETADTMQEAVKLSFNSAEKGDIVLLAPACTSFDMFESFEHRGKVFKKEVDSLQEELNMGKV